MMFNSVTVLSLHRELTAADYSVRLNTGFVWILDHENVSKRLMTGIQEIASGPEIESSAAILYKPFNLRTQICPEIKWFCNLDSHCS